MPFEWNEIQSDWLYELPVSYSQEEIVKAFNKVEKRFGSEFFDKHTGIRGTYIVTLIVDLNKILEKIEKGCCKLPQNGEIIRKIKRNNISLASTIIRLAAYYLKNGISVEFDPELFVSGRKRHPDLRVKFNEKWIYIEESSLDTSLHQKYIESIMERISDVIETVTSNLNIEVSLLKDDLRYEEVNEIIGKIKDLSNMPDQPQELNIEDLAQIFTYKKGQEKLSIEEKRPALGMAALSVGGGFERHLNVEIPFTDERIEKILKKSKQLSPKEHNMIVLDISKVPGNLEKWSESIKKMLQSDKHRRIGAVLLVQKTLTLKSLKVNINLITHPNASNTLPREFIQLTKDHFKQSSEYYYRSL